MTIPHQFSFDEVRQVLGGVLGADLHAKRIDSLCDATLGVLHSGSLAVAAIGHGLAAARGTLTKHAIKQVDRLLSLPWHFGSVLKNPPVAVGATIRNRRRSEQLGDDGAADLR